MIYIKAITNFFLGILEAIIFIPIMLITIPIKRYNETLYGKKRLVSMRVKDLGSELEITLPSGEKVIAPKGDNNGGKENNL